MCTGIKIIQGVSAVIAALRTTLLQSHDVNAPLHRTSEGEKNRLTRVKSIVIVLDF